MAKKNKIKDCPCGSGKSYNNCCGIFHAGKPAPDAERLMRSRYCAYVLQLEDYLLASWSPQTRPKSIEFDQNIKWSNLKIVSTKTLLENQASVHFIATFKVNGKAEKMEENSLFNFLDGRWFYLKAI